MLLLDTIKPLRRPSKLSTHTSSSGSSGSSSNMSSPDAVDHTFQKPKELSLSSHKEVIEPHAVASMIEGIQVFEDSDDDDEEDMMLNQLTLPPGEYSLLPIVKACNNFVLPSVPSGAWTVPTCKDLYLSQLSSGKSWKHTIDSPSSEHLQNYDEELLVPFFISLPRNNQNHSSSSTQIHKPSPSLESAQNGFPSHIYTSSSLSSTSNSSSTSPPPDLLSGVTSEHSGGFDPLALMESMIDHPLLAMESQPRPKLSQKTLSSQPIGFLRPQVLKALLEDNEKMKRMRCNPCWNFLKIGHEGVFETSSSHGEKHYYEEVFEEEKSTSRPPSRPPSRISFRDRQYSSSSINQDRMQRRRNSASGSSSPGIQSLAMTPVPQPANVITSPAAVSSPLPQTSTIISPEGIYAVAFADWINDEDDPRESRREHMDRLVRSWKASGKFMDVLGGWRDESYPIYAPTNSEPAEEVSPFANNEVAFTMERAATALFGLATFGVHMTGYTENDETGELKIWVAKRAATKQTWPSFLDNTVAGGLTFGDTPRQAMIRECEEEAALPAKFVSKRLKPAGIISYVYRSGNGWIQPEQQFIYDLKFPLSSSIIPKTNPADGEVGSFELYKIEEVLQTMFEGKWKYNCAAVVVDWFVRMGLLNDETDTKFSEVCKLLRSEIGVSTMA